MDIGKFVKIVVVGPIGLIVGIFISTLYYVTLLAQKSARSSGVPQLDSNLLAIILILGIAAIFVFLVYISLAD